MRILALTIFWAFAVPNLAQAQGTGAAAPAPSLLRLEPLTYLQGDPGYPAELSARGVQGKAEVTIKVGPDGTPVDLQITASSRSSELDAAAVKAVEVLKFGRKPGDDRPLPGIVVPVVFKRDSLATLGSKTCAEFNTDAAYFTSTFPELDPSKMEVISATVGAMVMAASPSEPGGVAAVAKRASAAARQIAAACQETPAAAYLQQFRDLMRKSGS